MNNKNIINYTKQNNSKSQKIRIKENITIDKARQLYQKYIKTMKILENK